MGRGWIVFALIVLGLIAYGVYYLFLGPSGPQSGQTIASVPAPTVAKPPPHSVRHTAKPASAATTNQLTPIPASAGQATSPTTPGTATSVAPGPGGIVYGKMNKDAHVVLRARADTHVLVQTEDGRAFINRVLKAGDIYQVPNMHGLALTAEHGNAVEVLLDGKSVRTAGNTGSPAEAVSIDATDLIGGHGARPAPLKQTAGTPSASKRAPAKSASPPQTAPGGTQ
ncbi:MAG TPA: RodZ domain-containing protein, partial [Rhizomicrobium sp.]